MAVAFYLNSYVLSTGEHNLRISVSAHGCKVQSTVGIRIHPKYWNPNKQRPKGTFTNSQGQNELQINAYLNSISDGIGDWIANLPLRKKIDSAMVNKVIDDIINRKNKCDIEETSRSAEFRAVVPEYERFIAEQSIAMSWAYSTKLKYGTVRNHLREYDKKLHFGKINRKFLEDYTYWLYNTINMQPVSVAKEHKLLRVFLKWASKEGFFTDKTFLDYSYNNTPEKPVIFLSGDELRRLISFEIPADGTEVELFNLEGDKYKKTVDCHNSLEKVRDLFLFSCLTGLRYSDAQALRYYNIVDKEIILTIQKTSQPLRIRINPQAQKILDKYKGKSLNDFCLPQMTNQKENEYLKILFEIFGLNDSITLIETANGIKHRVTYQRWQLMTTHAARRTFVCFALASGIPANVVAKFTGHRNLASMKPYIDVADNTAKRPWIYSQRN